MKKQEAIEWLKSMPQSESDMNHYLESGAIMRALAEKLREDEEYWEMLGLLHDVDWSSTKSNPAQHCSKCVDMLKEKGFDDEFISVVQSHGYGYEAIPCLLNKERMKKVEHALIAAETLTGIIYAYALMRGKKISDMEVKGLKKKFKDKTFAANCSRDAVWEIEKTGLELEEFFEIAIDAMKGIKEELGLE